MRKGLLLTNLDSSLLSADDELLVSQSGFLDRIDSLSTGFRHYGDLVWIHSPFHKSIDPGGLEKDGHNPCTDTDHRPAATEEGRGKATTMTIDSYRSLPGKPKSAKMAVALSQTQAPRQQRHSQPTEGDTSSPAANSNMGPPPLRTLSHDSCRAREDCAARLVAMVQPHDVQIAGDCFSAFTSTSLLATLRSRFVTKLYLCGYMTTASVYATAMDAACHGISIVLLHDCLIYHDCKGHDPAVQSLVETIDADIETSNQIVTGLMKN